MGPDNRSLVVELRHRYSFEAADEIYGAAPLVEAEKIPDPDNISLSLPLHGFDKKAIANLEKLVASKAALIRKSIGVHLLEGAEHLPIEQEAGELRFPWFKATMPAECLDAYTRFITALCGMAKTQKRITARPRDVENDNLILCAKHITSEVSEGLNSPSAAF